MTRLLTAVAALALLGAAALVWLLGGRTTPVVVASKSFTESVVLGEIASKMIRGAGVEAEHRRELGGTRLLFGALEAGEIDVYAEYTGTLSQEIFHELELTGPDRIASELARRGIGITRPLGFDNSYAFGMKPEAADRLGIASISDLRRHPGLRLGMSNEFMDRGDGWPSLRRHYGLPHEDARGIDHDLAYRALDSGSIDVMDLYTTDAEIRHYGLRVLDDDLAFFKSYHAVLLFRTDLAPVVSDALRRVEGRIDAERMRAMNARVKLGGESEDRVATDFVSAELGIDAEVAETTLGGRLWLRTREHLLLVAVAMFAGILVAVPLGIAAAKLPRTGQAILAIVGMLQTIPALALLVFMIPILGIYEPPAIAALFLYSLLPIVRSTHTGIRGIPLPIEESAEALGLPAMARLTKIELPLASPSILAGVKTSTVICIGFATLGALIGAGGYGQPIFTGIRLDDFGLILEGAVPAALLALAAQALFDVVERFVVPRGLRLRR